MSIIVNNGELRAALRKVLPALQRGDHSAVNMRTAEGNVHLAIHGHTLMMESTVGYMGQGEIDAWLAPHKLVSVLDGWAKVSEVEIAHDKSTVSFVVGRSTARLPVQEREVPFGFRPDGSWTMPAEVASAIRTARVCASEDGSRPILTGVLVTKECDVVATDSYVLYRYEAEGAEAPMNMLLPHQLCRHLPAEEVALELDDHRSRFGWTSGDLTVRGTLLDGQFPNWRQLIPSHHPIDIKVSRDEFKAAAARIARRLSSFGYLSSASVVRVLPGEGLRLEAHINDGSGYAAIEEIPAEVNGVELTFGVNPAFVARCLATLASPVVTFGATDALKPVSFMAERTRALLMPVRLT